MKIFESRINTILTDDSINDVIARHIFKFIFCYIRNVFEKIKLPDEFDEYHLTTGGDGNDYNYIREMITLNALNKIMIFDIKKLISFIDKVNNFYEI